jgi:hypothetical protein
MSRAPSVMLSNNALTSTWKDFIDPDIANKLSENEKKRQMAIWELLTTERDYVRDLGMIKTVRLD